MKLDNLAVVFIGTDKYLKFLPSWYQTCEEKLVPSVDKQYFVFTDGILEGTPENVSLYKQEHFCLLYTSPSPRDRTRSRMPSSA